MEKLEIQLTEEEIKILKKEMKKNPNEKVRNKSKVLYLRYNGCTEKEIMQKTDLTLCTILKYVKAFRKNGISSIYTTYYKGQPSPLNAYKDEITQEFENNPPSTRAEAVVKVKELFGIETNISSIGDFLKKTGCHTKSQEASQQKPKKNNNKYSWTFD